MKIRLHKGPFSGKVMDHPDAGQADLFVRGEKKMSRKARYEAEVKFYEELRTNGHVPGFSTRWRPPMVEARYRICRTGPIMMNGPITSNVVVNSSSAVIQGVFMHPDGSLFYEWTGQKREFQ